MIAYLLDRLMGLGIAICTLVRGSWAKANGGRASSKTHNNSNSETQIVSFTMQCQHNCIVNIDSTHRPKCFGSLGLSMGVRASHDSTILPLSHSHRGSSQGDAIQYQLDCAIASPLVPAFINGHSISFVAARFNQL